VRLYLSQISGTVGPIHVFFVALMHNFLSQCFCGDGCLCSSQRACSFVLGSIDGGCGGGKTLCFLVRRVVFSSQPTEFFASPPFEEKFNPRKNFGFSRTRYQGTLILPSKFPGNSGQCDPKRLFNLKSWYRTQIPGKNFWPPGGPKKLEKKAPSTLEGWKTCVKG